jgi:hypothetical protein
MSKWIKVERQEPPWHIDILAICKKHKKVRVGNIYPWGIYRHFRTGELSLLLEELSHWRPLPPLPKEIRNEIND